jgi:hypothetical protein
MEENTWDVVVVGAGPAGLMAADMMAAAGHRLLIAEAKPSVARKFLMAGKSGLNLTRNEPFEQMLAHYHEAADRLSPMVRAFDAQDIARWAEDLGQEMFTGSTQRVFPKAMKASPLLRSWLTRLNRKGVEIKTRWRWTGWQENALSFSTPDGPQLISPRATILALGGASWARLGSDGRWVETLASRDISITPFAASNIGVQVRWSTYMKPLFGQPIKGVALHVAEHVSRGEVVISSNGIEGGGIYPLARWLCDGAALTVDLYPDLSLDDVVKRLSRPRGKASLTNHLRKTLSLGGARVGLLQEFARPLPSDPAKLASLIKSLPIAYSGLRPMDEAISTAGGVRWNQLDDGLMLMAHPGVFCAGEMLDWDAPTGGYLLTACLATGRWAGQSAANWLKVSPSP